MGRGVGLVGAEEEARLGSTAEATPLRTEGLSAGAPPVLVLSLGMRSVGGAFEGDRFTSLPCREDFGTHSLDTKV